MLYEDLNKLINVDTLNDLYSTLSDYIKNGSEYDVLSYSYIDELTAALYGAYGNTRMHNNAELISKIWSKCSVVDSSLFVPKVEDVSVKQEDNVVDIMLF